MTASSSLGTSPTRPPPDPHASTTVWAHPGRDAGTTRRTAWETFSDTLLHPIELLVAWIMYGFHSVFTWIGLDPASGAAWALSIIGLVIVMRAAMIPLFVKQINASRKMQLIQPELQKIQKKYKGKSDPESRQAMTQETMALYKSEGTNPFSSCLPILVQSPFFFGLFRVLNGLEKISDGRHDEIGPITQERCGSGGEGDALRRSALGHLPRARTTRRPTSSRSSSSSSCRRRRSRRSVS